MQRREFISLSMAAAAGWPIAARGAQQSGIPVVAFVNAGSADGLARRATAFRKGLSEAGYIEGQNVTIEYYWLEGRIDRLPALMGDIVRRQVAVIATPGSVVTTLAAKAATATIPIVFGVPEDPVTLGLVSNLARPGGNATGINTFSQEVIGKRLKLLHDLLPTAARVAVLVDPRNVSSAQTTVREVQEAAQAMGLAFRVFNASSISEIDAAFTALAHEHFDALYVAPDAFLNGRGVQFATLAARERLPRVFKSRGCLGRRPDELWIRPGGHVSAGRRVYRPRSQGRKARRITCAAIDKVSVCHQSSHGAHAWHRCASRSALDRRRSDRIGQACCWPQQHCAGSIIPPLSGIPMASNTSGSRSLISCTACPWLDR